MNEQEFNKYKLIVLFVAVLIMAIFVVVQFTNEKQAIDLLQNCNITKICQHCMYGLPINI